MLSHYIAAHIKRVNQRRLLASGGLFLLIALLLSNNILVFPFSIIFWILLGWSLWQLLLTALFLAKPNSHPIVKRLALSGEVPAMSQMIESELQGGSQEYYGALLTRSWYLRPSFFDLDLVRLDQVVWAYEKIRKTIKNGQGSQTDCFVILKTRDGATRDVPMRGSHTQEFLQKIAQASPGVALGYSDDLNAMWNADSQALIKSIDAQRER